ncbi:MAG: dihydropteroate synthase [Bacteroidota bacterium]
MTLNCKGTLVDLNTPKVMGILNITPDSFYDGGRYLDEKSVVAQVAHMLDAGSTFIDLGAQSSRPGASLISEKEELDRILPVAHRLLKEFPDILLSIDTFRSNVAQQCLDAGAAMINDISSGNLNPQMMSVVAAYRVPWIMMHMRGVPENMQEQTEYTDLTRDILYFFSEKLVQARSLGIHDIIVDPGFGFSKTLDQNYALLNQLALFRNLEVPLLVGISRKSMIHKLLGITAQEALNGTTALHILALQKGASILRAHDVPEAMQCIALHRQLTQYQWQ